MLSVEFYGEAATLEPANMDIQFEYIRNLIYLSYSGRGYAFNARDALRVAENSIDIAPNDARARTAYALALLANDRYDEAALAALTASEIAPTWAEPRAYLSFAYYNLDRHESAQEQAAIAVELDSNSVDARRALALSLGYIGNYSETIRQLETAIQIHPQLAAVYFELALYYRYLENFEAAIQAFDRVLANDPRNVRAWTRKCETYNQMREDALAEEACKQAIDLDPSFPEAYRQLGMIQYQRRNFEGSISSLTTCIDLMNAQNIALEDQEIQCYYVQGLAHYYMGDCPSGMPLLQQAFEMNPEESIASLILEGMQLCAAADDTFSETDIPTIPLPTEVPEAPISVY